MRQAAGLAVLLMVLGSCTPDQAPTTSARPPATSTTQAPPTTAATTTTVAFAALSTHRLAFVDPLTLEPTGESYPSPKWVGAVFVSDEVVAFTIWPEAWDSWALVVADRATGEVNVSSMKGTGAVYDMFGGPAGELMVLEAVVPASDNQETLLVRAYDFGSDYERLVAEFKLDPAYNTVRYLGDGLIAASGVVWEPDGSTWGGPWLALFDLSTGTARWDVILHEVSLQPEVPEGFPADQVYADVIWDLAGNRAIIVHPLADLVTVVDLDEGERSTLSIQPAQSALERMVGWLIPAAHAKGGWPLASRSAAVIGDRLFVAGTEAEITPRGEYSFEYTVRPTGLQAVDLESMEIVGESEEPVSFLSRTPDGRYLLAGGVKVSGRGGEIDPQTLEYFGLFVIDAETLETVAWHDLDLDGSWALWADETSGVMYVFDDLLVYVLDPRSGDLIRTAAPFPTDFTMLTDGLVILDPDVPMLPP